MESLKELEEKVDAACAQLAALRKQNRSLKAKVRKLETELEAMGEGGDWVEQRAQVRKRVSKLAQGLESLL